MGWATCSCKSHAKVAKGYDGFGESLSAPAAAYPPPLCAPLVRTLLQAALTAQTSIGRQCAGRQCADPVERLETWCQDTCRVDGVYKVALKRRSGALMVVLSLPPPRKICWLSVR